MPCDATPHATDNDPFISHDNDDEEAYPNSLGIVRE
jgi:hypothetical protein